MTFINSDTYAGYLSSDLDPDIKIIAGNLENVTLLYGPFALCNSLTSIAGIYNGDSVGYAVLLIYNTPSLDSGALVLYNALKDVPGIEYYDGESLALSGAGVNPKYPESTPSTNMQTELAQIPDTWGGTLSTPAPVFWFEFNQSDFDPTTLQTAEDSAISWEKSSAYGDRNVWSATCTANAGELKSHPYFMYSGIQSLDTTTYGDLEMTIFKVDNADYILSLRESFGGCQNIVAITAPEFTLANVSDAYCAFSGCTKLTALPSTMSTANLSNMKWMFRGCTGLVNGPDIDATNATNMYGMFLYCQNMTNVHITNLKSSPDVSRMFEGCYSLTTVTGLESFYGNQSLTYMFYDCQALTTLPTLDLTGVTDISSMFCKCYALQSVNLTNTGSVTNMRGAFSGCNSMVSIPEIDYSNVKYVDVMFQRCYKIASGMYAAYEAALASPNLSSYSNMFNYCGVSENTNIYASEESKTDLFRIPKAWGGKMTTASNMLGQYYTTSGTNFVVYNFQTSSYTMNILTEHGATIATYGPYELGDSSTYGKYNSTYTEITSNAETPVTMFKADSDSGNVIMNPDSTTPVTLLKWNTSIITPPDYSTLFATVTDDTKWISIETGDRGSSEYQLVPHQNPETHSSNEFAYRNGTLESKPTAIAGSSSGIYKADCYLDSGNWVFYMDAVNKTNQSERFYSVYTATCTLSNDADYTGNYDSTATVSGTSVSLSAGGNPSIIDTDGNYYYPTTVTASFNIASLEPAINETQRTYNRIYTYTVPNATVSGHCRMRDTDFSVTSALTFSIMSWNELYITMGGANYTLYRTSHMDGTVPA